jgi:hypothetical protein
MALLLKVASTGIGMLPPAAGGMASATSAVATSGGLAGVTGPGRQGTAAAWHLKKKIKQY